MAIGKSAKKGKKAKMALRSLDSVQFQMPFVRVIRVNGTTLFSNPIDSTMPNTYLVSLQPPSPGAGGLQVFAIKVSDGSSNQIPAGNIQPLPLGGPTGFLQLVTITPGRLQPATQYILRFMTPSATGPTCEIDVSTQ